MIKELNGKEIIYRQCPICQEQILPTENAIKLGDFSSYKKRKTCSVECRIAKDRERRKNKNWEWF